jgi:hypothetical protein
MNHQLDIFEDSRDLMLHNDVLHALIRRDAETARVALRAFAGEFPDDPRLIPIGRLIDALNAAAVASFPTHADAEAAVGVLQGEVLPAAGSVWPVHDAAAWLAPLWAGLARRAAALPFDPAHVRVHAAALWLNAAAPAEAWAEVRTIESWRRKPQPLAWATEALWRSEGLDAAWPMIAELAWMAPQRLADLTRRIADPPMKRLMRAFDAEFDPGLDSTDPTSDLAWFPAWVLSTKPALARAMSAAEPGQQSEPEQGFRLLLALLELERQGRHAELIERRKRLMTLHAGLYRAYMSSR